jgi:sigma-B regulation protein RsbU (phosphoserine phosphatase)
MKKVIFLTLVVFSFLAGCRGESGLSLTEWSFAPGSAGETPSDCQQKGFQRVDSLQHLERFLPGQEGFIWLKAGFALPPAFKNTPLSLFIGRAAHADEAYINGHFAGQTGRFPPKWFSPRNVNRLYPVPETILDPEGMNTLLLKVYVNAEGFVAGPPSLLPSRDGARICAIRDFADSGISILLSFFALVLSLSYCSLFFIRRGGTDLQFALLCFVFSLFMAFSIPVRIPGFEYLAIPYPVFCRAEAAVLFFLGFCAALFFRSFLGRTGRAAIILLALAAAVPSAAVMIPQEYQAFLFVRFLAVFSLAAPGLYLLIILSISCFRRVPWARAIFLATIPFWIGAGFDIAAHTFFYFNSALSLSACGFALSLSCFGVVMSRRYVSFNDEVEQSRGKFEVMAQERLQQWDETSRDLSIREKELEEARTSRARDLGAIADFQTSLFAGDFSEDSRWDASLVFKPMSGLSADFYTLHYRDGVLSGAGIFDVSGHGLSAGLMAMLARSAVNRTFERGDNEKLGTVMEKINEELVRITGSSGAYLTGTLLRLKGNGVEYVNAGHSDLLFKRGKSGAVGVIDIGEDDIKGSLLGMDHVRGHYRSVQFDAAADDLLLLYSDCFSGSVNAKGETYGDERIVDSLRRAPSLSAEEIRDHLISDFTRFMWPATYGVHAGKFQSGGETFRLRDDFTMIVLKRL